VSAPGRPWPWERLAARGPARPPACPATPCPAVSLPHRLLHKIGPREHLNGCILSMASTNFQSAMYNFAGVVRNRWLERTAAREERRILASSGQFPTCILPLNHISKGRRLANMGAFKPFMVRAIFTGADLRQFRPKTIKLLDFYGFWAFYG
jgi:hypothetical protein